MYKGKLVHELSMDEVKEYYSELRQKYPLPCYFTDDERADLDICKERLIVFAYKILDSKTNGDIFLKTHPEVVATTIKKEGYLFDCVQLRNKEETIPFAEVYLDWWNAPCKIDKE